MHLKRLLLLACAVFAAVPSASAQPPRPWPPPAQPITTTPHAPTDLSGTAPIGSAITLPLTLTNNTNAPMVLTLYEGYTPSASARPTQPLRVPLPTEPGPLAPSLQNALAQAPNGRAEMLVYLADQADLSHALTLHDWAARGAWVYQTLTAHANRTQARLRQALAQKGYHPRSYWVVNALALTGDAALARWLAAQPEVGLVTANAKHQLDPLTLGTAKPQPIATASLTSTIAWGVAQIHAPEVWDAWGVRGNDVVVANIDTGVAYTHPALLNNYRGWNSQNINHDYAWYDAAVFPHATVPEDTVGHGTHTMGTMVGHSAETYTALGVAPGAKWIAVRGCAGIICADDTLIAAAQWLLAPTKIDGSAPRPDLRPHIVNNSWSKIGNDQWYTGYVAAWNAAGIFSVFAAGNAGMDGCASTGAPGNYATAFAVGATDVNDFITTFSSRGPAPDGGIKPDVAAPGLTIPSAWPDGTVHNSSGTSMAAPHVAGLVALLWSANPELIGDLASTRTLLEHNAVPRPTGECTSNTPVVPNNVYGWGRVDAQQTVAAGRVDVPWLSLPLSATVPANNALQVAVTLDARQVAMPGMYTARILSNDGQNLTIIPVTFTITTAPDTAQLFGRFTDRWTGAGIFGRLQLNNGPIFNTDANGAYTLTLPFGNYQLLAQANGYLSQTTTLSLTAPTTQAFTLTANLPHLVLTTPPLSATLPFGTQTQVSFTVANIGPQPLNISLSIPTHEWQVESTGPLSGTLYDLSSFPPLELGDDMVYTHALKVYFSVPIFGGLQNYWYVSSNGWISAASERPTGAAPWAVCTPWGTLPANTLAPFWADLDPSQGGAIRAGQIASDTFVVSYEAVPHWMANPSPSSPTYTFQVALHANGSVEFLYGSMSALPYRWSVGTSYSETRGYSLACPYAPKALANTIWRIRNQPASDQWVSIETNQLTLATNEMRMLPITFHGLGAMTWFNFPYLSGLAFTTNDPGQSKVELPLTLTVGLPPYQLWLPILDKNSPMP